MIKWTKPSGVEIETNELPATIEAAEKLGWKRDEAKKHRSQAKKRKPTQDI